MFPHICSVSRVPSTISGAGEVTGEPVVVFSALPCLVECLGAFRQKTILGDLSVLRYQFSWGSEVLQDDDLIEFSGLRLALRINSRDNLRPTGQTSIDAFQTGIAEEII